MGVCFCNTLIDNTHTDHKPTKIATIILRAVGWLFHLSSSVIISNSDRLKFMLIMQPSFVVRF
jgi:hypothetical protein